MGTIGAVARDRHGALAAATSTGGMTNKRAGRVGDTPILGAGTWADRHVAISCTGTGEAFLRAAAAHEVSALMRLAGRSLKDAAEEVALRRVPEAGGRGGLIAVDAAGNAALPFGTEGMYRGLWRAGEAPFTAIHAD
jgi:beta-aspartyl-peptidase (threonine type)